MFNKIQNIFNTMLRDRGFWYKTMRDGREKPDDEWAAAVLRLVWPISCQGLVKFGWVDGECGNFFASSIFSHVRLGPKATGAIRAPRG